MIPGFPPVQTLLASAAVIWLALAIVGLPFLNSGVRTADRRQWARIAILGSVCLFAGFVLQGVWMVRLMAWTAWPFAHGTWAMAIDDSVRVLSSGAVVVSVTVVEVAIVVEVHPRSRPGGWGALLLLVGLLAGGIWPAFSIPRWSSFLFSSPAGTGISPLAPYVPDTDPARWLDEWSRALMDVAPAGLLFVLAGLAVTWRRLRKAQAHGSPRLRESACAALALLGLLAISLGILELEKSVQWTANDQWLEYLVANGIGPESALASGVLDPPDVPRPLFPAGAAVAVLVGVAAALFGEFHLRGRRVLREPDSAAPSAGAP